MGTLTQRLLAYPRGAAFSSKTMTIIPIARIQAAYERTGLLGTIPESKRIAATAQAMGISEEMVLDALQREPA